ncbi:hypothetical protein [Streptomyces atratus]|uniref:hypothetical protein n=1 Tax=Streptomyces atratus TaxID=1893 RepID=UPI0018E51725|nr:hypothetical protein [Streptomyces atratus]
MQTQLVGSRSLVGDVEVQGVLVGADAGVAAGGDEGGVDHLVPVAGVEGGFGVEEAGVEVDVALCDAGVDGGGVVGDRDEPGDRFAEWRLDVGAFVCVRLGGVDLEPAIFHEELHGLGRVRHRGHPSTWFRKTYAATMTVQQRSLAAGGCGTGS